MSLFSYSIYYVPGTVIMLSARNAKINTHCSQKAYSLMEKIEKPTVSYITV